MSFNGMGCSLIKDGVLSQIQCNCWKLQNAAENQNKNKNQHEDIS